MLGRAETLLTRLPADQPLRGAEVGVARGAMSAALLCARPRLHLLLVDSWLPLTAQPVTYRETGDRFARLSVGEQAANRAAAAAATAFASARREILAMPSVEAAACVPTTSLDFVFLDGDHSEPGVAADLAAWAPRVRAGGWLGGHDYLHTAAYPFGVIAAVTAAAAHAGWQIETDRDHTWFVRLGLHGRS